MKSIKKAAQIKEKQYKEKSLPPLPEVLKYYVDNDKLLQEKCETEDSKQENTFQLPFANSTKVNIKLEDGGQIQKDNKLQSEFNRSKINQWMTNYEHFDDSKLTALELEDEETLEQEWCKNYGTPDPIVNISQVPCGGCGALLHCNDPAIPGYLPSEIFKGRTKKDLKGIECQRCHFLKEYNIALDVTVQPDEYEKLLQNIRHIKSLVLLMVDLMDFPCSIWPGIVDIIGTTRPLIIVGNKVVI
ncbi:unnamed protein product, partial [Iphiclides podalirius]